MSPSKGCDGSPTWPYMRRTFWWTQEPSDADRTRGASGDVYWVGFGEPLIEPYSLVSGVWPCNGRFGYSQQCCSDCCCYLRALGGSQVEGSCCHSWQRGSYWSPRRKEEKEAEEMWQEAAETFLQRQSSVLRTTCCEASQERYRRWCHLESANRCC